MKKLVFACAIAALAVSSFGATIKWRDQMAVYDGKGGSTKVADNTVAYLFMASTSAESTTGYSLLSRADFIDLVKDGTFSFAELASTYAIGNSLTLTSGKNSTYNAESTELGGSVAGDANKYYFALTDGERYFLSGEIAGSVQSASVTALSFSPIASQTKAEQNEAWFANADNAAKAGWYAVSVPEPFSGTLALLGLGAIALRRKMRKAKKA